MKGLPLITLPLRATAIEQSAVAMMPAATTASFSIEQRNGTRKYAATGEAPIEGECADR